MPKDNDRTPRKFINAVILKYYDVVIIDAVITNYSITASNNLSIN